MSDESVERIVSICSETQSMINIAAKQLFGLRQCRETVDLIREEISESESKLTLLLGKLLLAKAKLEGRIPVEEYGKMGQWLDIVGLSPSLSQEICNRYHNFTELLSSNRDNLERDLKTFFASDEDIQLLTTAMKQLKRAMDLLSHDPKLCVNGNLSTSELYWSNFRPTSTSGISTSVHARCIGHLGSSPKYQNHNQTTGIHIHLGRPPIGVITEPIGMPPSGRQSPQVFNAHLGTFGTDQMNYSEFTCQHQASFSNTRYTPPSTPQISKAPRSGKFPTTPPPKRRNKLNPDTFQPLMKSTSHESQLSLKVSQDSKSSRHPKKKPDNINIVGSSEAIASSSSSMRNKNTGATDEGPMISQGGRVSGQSSPLLSSPYRSPQLGKTSYEEASVLESHFRMNQLSVPPTSPGNQFMTNSITHKLKKSKLLWGTCDVCRKQLIRGRLCKNCRLKFHNDCVSKAPSICKYYHSFMAQDEDSSDLHHQNPQRLYHYQSNPQQPQHFDSSSTPSSCNSSTPSSPAVPSTILSSSSHWTPQQQNFNITHFTYPESKHSADTSSGVGSSLSSSSTPTVSVSAADAVNTNTSTDSDKSDKTITGSGDSSGDQNTHIEHFDSIDGSEDLNNLRRDNSISVALKEWDIPHEELNIIELIGVGRFGSVYKGYWHGEVAIKVLNTDQSADEQSQQLYAFKLEVANLRKTRHENLVLFMGACMELPKLAIVTSFVKGQTLFSKIYVRKEKFLTNQTIAIASQIAQGLGYLHAKGIVHKDLKTKNVFVENLKSSSSSENFKVVIGDFGLFSVSKLCQGRRKGKWLSIPHCWLCYLSPEIVKNLTPRSPFDDELPFSGESDIFAFGTIWFELLAGDWPYRTLRPETIIWMVGKGVNQPHLNVQSEFKELLLQCWAYKPSSRPNCQQLLKILEKLPRKRLARSPSHPIQLSRSAESIF